MIYDIDGRPYVPNNIYGKAIDVGYDTHGNAFPLTKYLDEKFNSFNTDIWSCMSGVYRNWQYLPEDYSNNAYVENGNLIVRNLKDNPTPDYAWSGAFVHSQGKFQFQYGTIVSRLKFPYGVDNYHATLWMLGNSPGEIDIAESDSGSVSAAVHYYDSQRNLHSKFIGAYPITAHEFNTYRMDWTADKITFRCNGKLLGSFNVEDATIDGYNSFRQPMYLIFNTNPYSTAKKLFATTSIVENCVDYIKVYGEQVAE